MTDTKRLSLHGRLRMAAACPDPNASLLAEAADAIKQHEAFRQEVSDAVEQFQKFNPRCFHFGLLAQFILPKPDPLVEALEEASGTNDPVEWANRFYAAIEKRGGKITWGEG